MMMDDI